MHCGQKNSVGISLRVIGRIRTPFAEAMGTPIQSVYAQGVEGQVIVDDLFAAALDDIESFDRVWLVYWMDRATAFQPQVVPYRDTRERGLFATRSPCRPNPIGMSAVRLVRREGCLLRVVDIDVLDDTPLLDIKPYVPEFDAHPSSRAGWFDACGVERKIADGRFHETAGARRQGEASVGGATQAASDIHERLRAFHARNLEYRRLGLDRLHAARLIVETAGALRGPALDVGTGKGLLAIELARTGMEVVSVDVDREEQELAKRLAQEAGVASRIRFVCGDAADLSYPDGTFGCVAMMDVLHHLDEPGPVLRGMARVLQDTGLIIVADFDEQGFDLVAGVHRREGRVHPRTATTIERAMAELEKSGCRCLGRSNLALHDVVVLVKER